MANEEVKLIRLFASPFSHRVELALKLKGIKYEFIEEDLLNKSSLLLNSNPVHKKVPVLLHNGKSICESLVILEYIDETWNNHVNRIFPEDPYQRAIARFWCRFIDEKCLRTFWIACWGKGEQQEKAKEEALESWRVLENQMKDTRFFGGDTIGAVDIVGNYFVHWVGVVEELRGVKLLTKDAFPKMHKWIEECWKGFRAIDQEAFPDRDKLFAFFSARAHLYASYT